MSRYPLTRGALAMTLLGWSGGLTVYGGWLAGVLALQVVTPVLAAAVGGWVAWFRQQDRRRC
ncbi:hypothetical protein PO878_03855 [Iamia majanohamensis]|uniref:Uncharacterized protein n=1 Tax=Iamia majanohamensis TaxID=467976 RepID=A0AAE9Y798_9ACTN|nr:hypothetical protein [Iamia majanohamensis]WCO67857.1 hypothetical protein PO878_03855 [Iamia majanohamensis]